jgi:ABC-type Fe3+/spermidine/putrescine transport system ATPase subunit
LDKRSTARTASTDTADPASFIRVRNLTKLFGSSVALDDVSICEGKGGTLALLGPSGCGKTTMLRCIAGLETPTRGQIEIGGRVVFDSASSVDLRPEQRALGIVFQSYAIWPHMSVAANVGFPLKVRGISRAEAGKRIERMLEIVGLAAMRERPATDLSGGQQQRVALARALVHEPSLVLFDEPMSNLDAQLRDQMRIELKMLQERLSFTAVYVTHDQSEAFALARTVVVMNRGRVEAIGAPREIARQPSTPFVARFLGYNVVEGTISEGAAAGVPARITLAPTFAVSLASQRQGLPPAHPACFACGASTLGSKNSPPARDGADQTDVSNFFPAWCAPSRSKGCTRNMFSTLAASCCAPSVRHSRFRRATLSPLPSIATIASSCPPALRRHGRRERELQDERRNRCRVWPHFCKARY